MNEELYKKIEKKTSVDKDTIIDLARMINENGYKDEKTLRQVISKLSLMTGKKVTNEMEDKIIKYVIDDKVPKNIDKMF